MRTLLIILLSLFALYLIYALLVFFFQKKLIFHPTELPDNHVYRFDNIEQDYREINIESKDGIALNSLLFKADNPKGIIVFYHGNAGNLEMWGTIAEKYLQRQFHLLVWDYREYGKTKGTLTFDKLYQDSEVVYKYARKLFPNLPVIPYGVSLGTGLAAHVALKYQPDHLILETPYYSMNQLAREHFPGLPYHLLLKFPLNTFNALKGFNGEVFMIHGTRDQIIPYNHSERLNNAFPDKIHLTAVHGSGHNDLTLHQSYKDWLDKALSVYDVTQ